MTPTKPFDGAAAAVADDEWFDYDDYCDDYSGDDYDDDDCDDDYDG